MELYNYILYKDHQDLEKIVNDLIVSFEKKHKVLCLFNFVNKPERRLDIGIAKEVCEVTHSPEL